MFVPASPRSIFRTAACATACVTLCAAAVLGAMSTSASAQDHPTPNPASRTWELKFDYGQPQAIEVGGNWYWYLPYTVTNNARQDVTFLPSAVVQGDNGQIIRAQQVVSTQIFRGVVEHSGNDLMVNPTEAAGPIREGVDFAIQSALIWPAFNSDVDQFTIFVEGLSGEVQSFTHPETGETIRLRRNLMIEYAAPGQPTAPNQAVIEETNRQHVMR